MTEFQLSAVTPLFLGGATARDAPAELRPPAFRGALRYWLRAAAGHACGGDMAALKAFEAGVFGSVDGDAGGASTVTLRLRPENLPPSRAYNKTSMGANREVHKNGRKVSAPSGRNYLYWSMTDMGGPPRYYFPVGSTFTLILGARPGAPGGAEAQRRAVAALWLLVQLGGIGSRSRRTGGSLAVRHEPEGVDLPFVLAGRTPQEVAAELERGLQAIPALLAAPASAPVTAATAPFDILFGRREHASIWVLGVWNDPMAAVEEVGARLCDFRTYSNPDHDNVAKWLRGGSIPGVARAAFGLPIPYRYSNNGPKGTIQGAGNPAIDRRASPLWLKISAVGAGRYAAIATLFRSQFLPPGEKLQARTWDGDPQPIPPPADYTLVENWIHQNFNAIEATHA